MSDGTGSGGPAGELGTTIAEILRRLEVLEAENAALRAREPARPPAAATPAPPAGRSRAVSRRGLLAGAAGAAAVGAVGLVASAAPAAANGEGQALVIGTTNTSTDTTSLSSASLSATLNLVNSDLSAALYGQGGSTDAGISMVAGVVGDSHDLTGVGGVSALGTGVYGARGTLSGPVQFAGVVGDSADSIGVLGLSASGSAVVGRSGTAGLNPEVPAGVIGEAQFAVGVFANSVGNTGLLAVSATADAVEAGITATGSKGVAVRGETAGLGNAANFSTTNTATTAPTVAVTQSANAVGVLSVGDGAQLRLQPAHLTRAAPTTDKVAHQYGELVEDGAANLWLCTKAGTPGTWRKLAGPATAGALHVLPAPVRVYDSRPGLAPHVGPQTPLRPGSARTLDMKANNSGVPAGAAALVATCLIVDAAPGSGNCTIWAAGVATPVSNSLVWGGTSGRASSLVVTALDASARAQVAASVETDIVLDVVGYYL